MQTSNNDCFSSRTVCLYYTSTDLSAELLWCTSFIVYSFALDSRPCHASRHWPCFLFLSAFTCCAWSLLLLIGLGLGCTTGILEITNITMRNELPKNPSRSTLRTASQDALATLYLLSPVPGFKLPFIKVACPLSSIVLLPLAAKDTKSAPHYSSRVLIRRTRRTSYEGAKNAFCSFTAYLLFRSRASLHLTTLLRSGIELT